MTDEAKDLMSNLICDQSARFKTLDQFKNHAWFTGQSFILLSCRGTKGDKAHTDYLFPVSGIEWENMRSVRPPYQPQVSGPDDTSNFDIDELRPPNNNPNSVIGPHGAASKESLLNIHLPFVGFTSTLSNSRFSGRKQAQKDCNVQSVKNYNHVIVNHENNITVIETIDEPAKDFEAMSNTATASPTPGGVAGDPAMHKLEVDLQVARQEWSELSAIVGEIRKEKNSLSHKLRSKEEEIEQQIEKNSELRQQLRNAERTKRQQLEEIIGLQTEIDRERHVRKECEYN